MNSKPTSQPWSDLDRPPLNEGALRRALLTGADAPPASGGRCPLWTSLDVVTQTGSTNVDLAERARAGAAEGAVLVAEEQTAGRGRLDRRWSAPARSGLFFSVLLRPAAVPAERWGWLPLLAGVATATAVSRIAGVDTALKWPNDLLVTVGGEERKAAGILAERVGTTGIVVGVGLNVTLREDELPVPNAGSLALAGAAVTDRDPLLRAVLRSIAEWYVKWRDAGGDPHVCGLRETYAAGCATLGRTVRATLPGGREVEGNAVSIDDEGRLVLAADGAEVAVGAGDVVHVR
ncbi:biotin--[acetyl-CoA-carboxylase] ligase [Streptomyces sp. RB6PN25]|uniref:biotin--[biotin carboxyl-carrier protein] ligase n=1 Tax=Streptomyces humicola TaxID=2953240 RepID=A0ABT1PWY8_9ACTN|nr:biotin--[acetyl-CoA-carboxylase] ligase [Streptomyces humicola]MCQ4082196.1 biotin--[acetyl-CoA-carboxylase] ligase [Streptomyces humicola]